MLVLFVLALASVPIRRAAMCDGIRLAGRPAGLVALALIGWCALSTAWSAHAGVAVATLAKMGLVFAAGAVLVLGLRQRTPKDLQYLQLALATFGVLLVPLLVVETLTDGALGTRIKGRDTSDLITASRGAVVLVLMLAPLALLVGRRVESGWIRLALVVLVAWALLALPAVAVSVAAGAGGLMWVAAWFLPRAAPLLLATVMSATMLATPWLSTSVFTMDAVLHSGLDLPSSWLHRIAIWEFTSRLTLDAPLVGHGFDSADAISRETETASAYRELLLARGLPEYADRPPLHPHNIAVQLWYEFGSVGVALACVLLLLGARALSARAADRDLVAMASAWLAVFLCISSVGFGMWQAWWQASVWLSLAGCVAVTGHRHHVRVTS